tara:strand:+ start:427 stop:729 length:303 start_codon:yes stop_codon:yes gene_type:complete
MTKNKYATIQDLVPGKNFDFFNNFSDQVFKDKTININDVGQDWFDCLNDDQQTYVQQMPKYSHLNYDEVIKQYDQDSLPNIIKRQESMGWKCDKNGNIIA